MNFIFFALSMITINGKYDYLQQGQDWSTGDCKKDAQTPINIISNDTVFSCDNRGLEIYFDDDNVETQINKSSAMTTAGDFGKIYIRKGDDVLKYNALQFHIHAPSEH